MLTSDQYSAAELPRGAGTIHNYYEPLVIEAILGASERSREDPDFLADTACVALNRLPPRYIRHSVDMSFFMSDQELEEIQDKVVLVVNDAIAYVLEREQVRQQAHSDTP